MSRLPVTSKGTDTSPAEHGYLDEHGEFEQKAPHEYGWQLELVLHDPQQPDVVRHERLAGHVPEARGRKLARHVCAWMSGAESRRMQASERRMAGCMLRTLPGTEVAA